ncbi:MAG: FeoB-associated Cys-rich membrane protein [Victivallaceae bacterium]|nr:FeoB-associated Cys-rich membrane protein [Victivallaceae bacterium]
MREGIIIAVIALIALIFLARHFRKKGANCSSCTQNKCSQRDDDK